MYVFLFLIFELFYWYTHAKNERKKTLCKYIFAVVKQSIDREESHDMILRQPAKQKF